MSIEHEGRPGCGYDLLRKILGEKIAGWFFTAAAETEQPAAKSKTPENMA